MKKTILLTIRIILSTGIIVLCVAGLNKLEYIKQFNAIDNPIGAMPIILIAGISIFLIIIVWKKHKNARNSTITFVSLAIMWSILLVPAITGNWYPLAGTYGSGSASPDLSVYDPFIKDTKTAELDGNASIRISDDMPVLDGATALYPVYTAFANAVYDESKFSKDTVVCTNTPNAYESIITGKSDIIFVAGPSEQQVQAAKDAGADLVYTPVGKEAFVFLTGKSNPIDELSYEQIHNIYSGKTAKWQSLGWKEGGDIIIYQRPEGSGSQTGLQNIMGDLPLNKPKPLPDNELYGTGSMLKQVSVEWNGVQPALGYSYRYYAISMYPNDDAKLMKIEGVYPSNETIADGSYPFAADFYAVTNGKPTGNTAKLIDWILSKEGQYLIEKTGYTPKSD